MDEKQLTKQQIVERGKQIYTDSLQAMAERDHRGQFIVIDVRSGDHEIAKNDVEATLQILERRPEAVLYGIRIGEEVAYRFGHGKVA